MSTSLYWRPVVPVEHKSLYSIKFKIAPRYLGHDGSLVSDKVILDSDSIPYLEGLRDAGNAEVSEEAQELIDAIRKHGEIEIWTE